jgi:hypothetical protein
VTTQSTSMNVKVGIEQGGFETMALNTTEILYRVFQTAERLEPAPADKSCGAVSV